MRLSTRVLQLGARQVAKAYQVRPVGSGAEMVAEVEVGKGEVEVEVLRSATIRRSRLMMSRRQ